MTEIRRQLRAGDNGDGDPTVMDQLRVLRRELVVVRDEDWSELERGKFNQEIRVLLTLELEFLDARRVDEAALL